MKIALCFMTKDRVELSKQTFPRLQEAYDAGADIWWLDGSVTKEGEELPEKMADNGMIVRHNVRGGPDAAVAYAVTECLRSGYDYIGIIENDVLLGEGWFKPTMDLFLREVGGHVGAVSARCYEDRVLFKREGHNVMHNLGFGMVIWTAQAARLMLKHMRTHRTLENRRTFARLAGVDIGTYWAFRVGDGWVCADWGVDRVLAEHGLCSLALDPSPVEMIGQVPPLHEQGLTLATGRDLGLAHDTAKNFDFFRQRLQAIRRGDVAILASPSVYEPGPGWMHFAHQLGAFQDYYIEGDVRLRWTQGFGPFGYRADADGVKISLRVSGPASFMVSGLEKGGAIWVRDLESGYEANPVLPPAAANEASIMGIAVPGETASRILEIELSKNTVLFGLMTQFPQPLKTNFSFDHAMLPPI